MTTNIGSTTTALPAQQTQQVSADTPDQTFPTLLAIHVAVMRAAGTPDTIIASMAAQNPTAEAVDREIQSKILQDPEAWDATLTQLTGQDHTGVARAGLTAAFPQITLPAPGTGNPGYTYDGTPQSGIVLPGVTTPLTGPMSSQGKLTGLVALAGLGVAGFLGYKYLHRAPKGGAEAIEEGVRAVRGGGATMTRSLAGGAKLHGTASQLAHFERMGGYGMRGAGLDAFEHGGSMLADDFAEAAATMRRTGFAGGDGFEGSAGLTAAALNGDTNRIADRMLARRAMLAGDGSLGQLAQYTESRAKLEAVRLGHNPWAGAGAGTEDRFERAVRAFELAGR